MSPPKSASVKRKRNSPRSPSASTPRQRSPSSWSPRTKQAARTIKRAVTRMHAQNKYYNYTRCHSARIRDGQCPTHFSALLRRMRMFPVNVNVPLYKAIKIPQPLPNNFPTKEKVLKNGYLVNKSFASFTKNRSVSREFLLFSRGKSPYILVLPPGRYPAINREKFVGNANEMEVTLAPGIYTVNRNRPLTNNGNIRVTYKPIR